MAPSDIAPRHLQFSFAGEACCGRETTAIKRTWALEVTCGKCLLLSPNKIKAEWQRTVCSSKPWKAHDFPSDFPLHHPHVPKPKYQPFSTPNPSNFRPGMAPRPHGLFSIDSLRTHDSIISWFWSHRIYGVVLQFSSQFSNISHPFLKTTFGGATTYKLTTRQLCKPRVSQNLNLLRHQLWQFFHGAGSG